jgi:hypothetical protein
MAAMPIAHIATLWSLAGHPAPEKEWSLARKLDAVAAAGFDGFMTRLTPEHRRLAEKRGLRHLLGGISSSNPEEFAARIREQKEGGAVHINVQMDDDDTPPRVAVRHWLRMEREAERIGSVVMSLEVHRDTCTETPEKTYEIAERYHRATGQLLKLNFDFSHHACVKHLAPANYAARLLTHPDLVQHSEQVHFRPFNGHHCQVPVTHRGVLTPEVKDYLAFVCEFMRVWQAGRGNADRTLFAHPEMGPYGGYNVTGWPPAWPDAITLRGELAKAWRRASTKNGTRGA